MKYTAVFALFFLLPLVYGNTGGDWRKYFGKYFNQEKIKSEIQSKWDKIAEYVPQGEEYGNNKPKYFAKSIQDFATSVQGTMDSGNNKAREMVKSTTDKLTEKWGIMKNKGGEYKEDMEEKKKMVQERMEHLRQKFEEMLEEFKGKTDSYVKIGHQALDYLNNKLNEYLDASNVPLDEQLKEFQTMFEGFMESANQTFQEILEQAQERIEDPEVAARIEELTAFRDAFITQSQEGIKFVRQYIEENFSTPEARQSFFEGLNKMLEDIKPDWDQIIENFRNKSNDMIEIMLESFGENVNRDMEYREAMKQFQAKIGTIVERFTKKYEHYMNKDGQPMPNDMNRKPIRRPIKRRFKPRKKPEVEQGKGQH